MDRHFIMGIALCTIVVCGCTGEKALLDEEVRRLCAKDGGMRVYEQVKLPPDRFDKYGFINFYRRMAKEPLGPDYVFESRTDYYRKGNPEMRRNYYRVIRRSDGKVLGEAVRYSRRGGDLPGPWHESVFACPEHVGDVTLLKELFVKTD